MTSRVGAVLESAMHSPGIAAAVLVDSDGYVTEAASLIEGDLALQGAVASGMLRQWASLGTDLGLGELRSMLIEGAGGPTTITPAGSDAVVLLIGNRVCHPGRVLLEARRACRAMGDTGFPVSNPESGVLSPLDHFDQPAGKMEEDPHAPAAKLTSGEVILTGTHTFRLVTKLLAQLLRVKGVRSSSLRAYSPSSTIIDVVLENDATLAIIEPGCLEEFLIEGAEEGGTRLVLRPRTARASFPDPIGSPR
jgi:predicted regulator of Ras-like GTPase activity (Roadblock/LC7/MglB family)